MHPLKVGRFELFSSGQITEVLVSAVRMLRVVAVLFLGYAYLSAVFSFFPWTRGFASTLLGWVMEPLRLVGVAFLQFIPKLFFIVVIIAVTRFVLKVIRLVFHRIASGRLELPNFPSEWADPTYKLVRLFVLVVALIVVFPYLPGSQSDAFKGVSVFVGILEEPKPYILQTSLDDSYVSYQLNASTDRPNDIHLTYARLHENIQDQFNAGGIEILSPQYAALRDGNKITIPDSRPAADHHAPAFRVQTFPSGG